MRTVSMAKNIVHLPIKATYDRWAATYDSDGKSMSTPGLYRFRAFRKIENNPVTV